MQRFPGETGWAIARGPEWQQALASAIPAAGAVVQAAATGAYRNLFGDLHNHNQIGYAQGTLERTFEIAALVLTGPSHSRDFGLSDIEIPVTKIFASNDGVVTSETSVSMKLHLPAHTQWIEIAGGNHSQFGYYGHQLFDGLATIGRAEQERRTLEGILVTLGPLQEPGSYSRRSSPGRRPGSRRVPSGLVPQERGL